MDFYMIRERAYKTSGRIEIYPDWLYRDSKDLMVRGNEFYAIWNEEKGLWSTDEFDVVRLVDEDLRRFANNDNNNHHVHYLDQSSSNSWNLFKKYLREYPDNYKQLDSKLTFSNTEVKRSDYVSKRLNYPLEPGNYDAYDELISTLYDPEERAKIEWSIGAIISGDTKKIQKFLVFYGEAGTGKSTILNIVEKLFDGYCTVFEAKELTSNSNQFSTAAFKNNPLVAIQHDGDLSRIEDNTKLNSIVSHEIMVINDKYSKAFPMRINSFLMMGTNKPVKITDSKSGVIRRLIDVHPSGRKVPVTKYRSIMEQIDFELGAIAYHCLEVYREMGQNYYNDYKPMLMIDETDMFYNFVEENYYIFKEQDGTTLKAAWAMYKEYCDETAAPYKLPMYKFRNELKTYFANYKDEDHIDGKHVRKYYSGFLTDKFKWSNTEEKVEEAPMRLTFDCTESIFDKEFADCPAQYASKQETPVKKWDDVDTTLNDIDTSKLHYVRIPENHIVIDFDLKDEDGNKSLQKNMEAADKWPPTYSELSKGGSGIHLHYIYDGDVDQLSALYSEGIEVKVFKGHSSLRRRLSKCNSLPIAHINSGLPLKGGKKAMVNFESVKSEKALRTMIKKSLNKEYEPHATKPSIDFIFKILEDAYNTGMNYDVRDMRPAILAFANNSTHNSEYCLSVVAKMHFYSETASTSDAKPTEDEFVFYDVEVFPNLFVVVFKRRGLGSATLINPTPMQIEELLKYKLVGFNCRRYDNHILYARLMGYDNEQLYKLSQRIVNGSRNCLFGEAYNLSYADVYDFSSKKQSLKKFEIELGIHHQELGLPWDEPVPEEMWQTVADYCINDVVATEAVFEARKQDFIAREVLADISGLTVNDTTQMHTAKIIFGNEKKPQSKFVYTDLSEMFPGYKFDAGKSYYRGEEPGEGGYVYSEPGMYTDVALLDIASMHPHSLISLNLFGPYTDNFKQLLDARLAIKHKDFDSAKKMLNGALEPYLESEDQATALAYALKIVINSVYGLTSAKFDCKFKDPRNVDNIVAKRGALFMIDLKHEVQKRGYTVAHIKTDSIKIPNADQSIIDFVMEFGKKYGYTFEHEATYDRMCLVNDAVYIAKDKADGHWTATGTQFQVPFVFKTLFSHEKIEFEDLCETKTVSTALYLDMNESLPEGQHDYHFVGKAGAFTPIKAGCGGGELMRQTRDGTYSYATGAKGFRWLESEMVKILKKEEDVDYGYYYKLVNDAKDNISNYGDFEWFVD